MTSHEVYTQTVSRITPANLCLYFLQIFCFYARASFTWASVVWAIHPYVHSCLTCIWPSCTLPAVLTLVCVDSKHSCRSQRPRSGRTRGYEGQCWRGDGAQRERAMAGNGRLERRERLSFHWGTGNTEGECLRKTKKIYIQFPHFFKGKLKSTRWGLAIRNCKDREKTVKIEDM